ncbi:hypothetical protein WR25_08391 [Diploscapter pachys]|uniref:Large ribosomal subunit protein bL17m n=1 Tax=Diploscapter pachys TaxID=2018661 RepID=A0A2A2JNN5_9BILA|nr:hypothetical protein WR25_08391 [Diploscapter pachys]
MSSKVASSFSRIMVPIGHIPQKLKSGTYELRFRLDRLNVLRRLVNRTIREERIETRHNRAVEVRPYVERLLQMAVEGDREDPMIKEQMDWWLVEKDLIHKVYEILAPRLKDTEQPYTSFYMLPTERVLARVVDKLGQVRYYNQYKIGILEINGNPFPPVLENQQKMEKVFGDDRLFANRVAHANSAATLQYWRRVEREIKQEMEREEKAEVKQKENIKMEEKEQKQEEHSK